MANVKSTHFNCKYAHNSSSSFCFDEPSLTQPQFGYECDINNIVSRCVVANVNVKPPIFNTVIAPNQYEEALVTVANAKSQFENLPSDLRAKFHNNPKEMLSFVSNDKNYEEAFKYGLIDENAFNKYKAKYQPSTVITEPNGEVINEVSSH